MTGRPAQTTVSHEVDLLLCTELLGPVATRTAPLCDPPGLHDCPACALPFVVPGEVRDLVGVDRVRLELHCANCGWSAVETHGDDELSRLDAQLDRSFADLLWTLELVWTANEEAAIGRFATALAADAILPDDF